MGQIVMTHEILMENPDRKRNLREPFSRWEGSIKMGLT
jgi:hypothetical protein